MTLDALNHLPSESAREALLPCCGSEAWVTQMIARRPYTDVKTLHQHAGEVWWQLNETDWLEAFSQHPKIGERNDKAKWSAAEQAGMARAHADTVESMFRRNREYEEKFGWIFIVCATGKSASEMLAMLENRLGNNASDEIRIAAEEQSKITHLRLTKLLAE